VSHLFADAKRDVLFVATHYIEAEPRSLHVIVFVLLSSEPVMLTVLPLNCFSLGLVVNFSRFPVFNIRRFLKRYGPVNMRRKNPRLPLESSEPHCRTAAESAAPPCERLASIATARMELLATLNVTDMSHSPLTKSRAAAKVALSEVTARLMFFSQLVVSLRSFGFFGAAQTLPPKSETFVGDAVPSFFSARGADQDAYSNRQRPTH